VKQKEAIILLAAVVLLGAVYVNMKGDSTSANMVNLISAAVESTSSYRVETNVVVETEGTSMGIPIVEQEVMHGVGETDIGNRRMHMEVELNTSRMQAPPVRQKMDIYLIDDLMKVYIDGNHTVRKVPGEEIWRNRAQIQQQVSVMEGAVVSVVGEEEVSGVSCYVLDVEPDKRRMMDFLIEQSGVRLDFKRLDDKQVKEMVDLIEDVSITQWVGKQDYLPRRFKLALSLDTGEIVRRNSIDMRMWDYGKEFEIELPAAPQENVSDNLSV